VEWEFSGLSIGDYFASCSFGGTGESVASYSFGGTFCPSFGFPFFWFFLVDCCMVNCPSFASFA
jgi:hypothetical protein